MVGHTTPIAELNHERMPGGKARMATAVFGVMIEARPFDISATPPTSETMFISIPMPVTISRVDKARP